VQFVTTGSNFWSVDASSWTFPNGSGMWIFEDYAYNDDTGAFLGLAISNTDGIHRGGTWGNSIFAEKTINLDLEYVFNPTTCYLLKKDVKLISTIDALTGSLTINGSMAY
jgi:hypothetical protein